MKGIYHEKHLNHEIIVIDYSIVPHEDEFKLMQDSLEYLASRSGLDNYVLEILSNVRLTQQQLDFLPEYVANIKHYVTRWASIGIGNEIVKNMPDLPFKGKPGSRERNLNINWFETKEEAIQFLIP